MHTEVIVIGAGLVGLAAAIALAEQNKHVVLVSSYQPAQRPPRDENSWDERVYALTPATENWLNALGVWAHVDKARVSAIDAMHVWGADADVLLKSEDAHLAKLGLMIEDQNLMAALWQKVEALGVTVIADADCVDMVHTPTDVRLNLVNKINHSPSHIVAKLIVAADGANSWVRQKSHIGSTHHYFEQTAIVANFKAEKSHGNVARQWFNQHDTLALLPLPNQYVSIVWSLATAQAKALLKLSVDVLSEKVQAQAQNSLGKLTPIGKIEQIELHQQTATTLIGERVLLVGDAAHRIHPMAGQGVNLGFRDIIKFTELSAKLHVMHDIGEKRLLRQYERARKLDVLTMNGLTTGLDHLFASEQTLLRKATQFGMRRINAQSSIKKRLINRAVS